MAEPITVPFSPGFVQADIQRIVGAAPGRPVLILDEQTGTLTAYTDDRQTVLMEFRQQNGKYTAMTTNQNHDDFIATVDTLRDQGDATIADRLKKAFAGTTIQITRTDELHLRAGDALSEKNLQAKMDEHVERINAVQEKVSAWVETQTTIPADQDDREIDTPEQQAAQNAALAQKMPKALKQKIAKAMNAIPTEILAIETGRSAEALSKKPDATLIAPDELKILQSINSNSDITAMMVTNREFAESMAKVVQKIKHPGDQSHSKSVEQELQKQARLFKQTTGETLQR